MREFEHGNKDQAVRPMGVLVKRSYKMIVEGAIRTKGRPRPKPKRIWIEAIKEI